MLSRAITPFLISFSVAFQFRSGLASSRTRTPLPLLSCVRKMSSYSALDTPWLLIDPLCRDDGFMYLLLCLGIELVGTEIFISLITGI